MSKGLKTAQGTPVLVTTEHRGVFFGYLAKGADKGAPSLELERARCAVYWRDCKGFLGLASEGPNPGCRIGPPAPKLLLHGVTSVTECSPAAVEAWELGHWS